MRAVIFDYGDVLCSAGPAAHRALLSLSGLDAPTFEQHYWRDRHDYDLGRLDGPAFWRKFAALAGRSFTPAQIHALVEHDVLMWTTRLNHPMLAWAAALQNAGLATAILSNMPHEIARCMRQEFGWLACFNQLTLSCELGLAKPDPAIYAFTCEQLEVRPEDALFLDDKQVNTDAAQRFGLPALRFQNVAQLRRDLAAHGWLQHLPPPGNPLPPPSSEAEPEVSA